MRNFETSLEQFCEENNLQYLLEEYASDNELSPSQIGAHSKTPVKWICAFGHEETESPFNRLRRGFCSVCGKKRNGSFAQLYPDLLEYWSKKNIVSPERIPPTYSKLVQWKCKHGHTWERRIALQAKLRNCPHCSIKESGFFANRPEMLEEWDYDRNEEIDPHTVSAFSHQKYYWICKNGHSYTESPRQLMRRSARCPVCTSLGFVRPDLISEWHPTKNGSKTPYDYSANSQTVAWFVCQACGQEYSARIALRAKRESRQCPNCR